MGKLRYVYKSRMFWISMLLLANSIAGTLTSMSGDLELSPVVLTSAMIINSVLATLIALLKVEDNVETSKLYKKLEELQYNAK